MSLDELLAEEPFSFLATKSGLVQVSYNGRNITTLSGRDALKFLSKVGSGDRHTAQLVMAKVTGHFKNGSERVAKNRRREH